MFVRYETMAKHLHSIAEFLDAPSLESFMFRDRKSDFRRLNPRHREGLERTFGAFKAWLDSLPDLVLLEAATARGATGWQSV
jgi:hypothetical protein